MRLKFPAVTNLILTLALILGLAGCSAASSPAKTGKHEVQFNPELKLAVYPSPKAEQVQVETVSLVSNVQVIGEQDEWLNIRYAGGEGWIPKWYASGEAAQIQPLTSGAKVLRQDFPGSLYPNGPQIVNLTKGKLLTPLKEWNGWYEVGILTVNIPNVQYAWLPAAELLPVQEMIPAEGYLRTGTEVFLDQEFEKMPQAKPSSAPYEMIVFITAAQGDYIRVKANNGWTAWTRKDNLVFTPSDSIPKELPSALVNGERRLFVDDSSAYQTGELTELNEILAKTIPDQKLRIVTDLYFLDDEHLIFSVNNGSNKDNPEESCDLYRYGLESKELKLLCRGYMLYCDSTVTVKDAHNFSISRGGSYLKIQNDAVHSKRFLFWEARKTFPAAAAVFYNEENDKMLILEADLISKTNKAFVTAGDFTSPEQLPFKNIYRVQWADNKRVLVAYKDGNHNSFLALYNLTDESTTTLTLPEKSFFIDPVIYDQDLIRYLYLDEPANEGPWGFLNLNTWQADHIYFECSVVVSLVKNGRMAGFIPSSSQNIHLNNQLFVYDNTGKEISLRDRTVDYPQALAVSPDSRSIVFTVVNPAGESKFFLNAPISKAEG